MDVLNLDCMDADELELLASYAGLKAKAMRLRESGEIEQALIAERALDRMYAKLPEELQW